MGTRKTESKSANKKSENKVLQDLQTTDNVIAIFAADIHLSHKPPVWRSAEPDWYAAMKRPLDEIREVWKQCQSKDKPFIPIFYAGDIFDKWNSPAELINFTIDNLPSGDAIPGQHDLPLHNLEDIKKSAFWTLFQANKIGHLDRRLFPPKKCNPHKKNGLKIYSFPYGTKIQPLEKLTCCHEKNLIHIAIVHEYCWIDGYSYPGVPKESKFGKRISGVKKGKWLGYDVVVYGDNHKGFQYQFPNCKTQIFNCGTLMRRKSDEIDYQPQIGLLLDTGKIISHKLDISQDKYLISDKPINEDEKMDLSDFIAELELLGDTALDFEEAIKQYYLSKKTKKAVKEILNKAMEK